MLYLRRRLTRGAAAARHRAAQGSASLRPLRGTCGPFPSLPPARSACWWSSTARASPVPLPPARRRTADAARRSRPRHPAGAPGRRSPRPPVPPAPRAPTAPAPARATPCLRRSQPRATPPAARPGYARPASLPPRDLPGRPSRRPMAWRRAACTFTPRPLLRRPRPPSPGTRPRSQAYAGAGLLWLYVRYRFNIKTILK